jgi:SAM-dependent methyltransferase
MTSSEHLVLINGIPVTGPEQYSIASVRSALKISDADLLKNFQGKKVLELGSGRSPLLDTFIGNKIDATGLDPWVYFADVLPSNYDGKQLRAYYKKFQQHLVAGDALATPFSSKTLDVVVSHNLANNLPAADAQRLVSESVRLLRPGGEARHWPILSESIAKISADLRKMPEVAEFNFIKQDVQYFDWYKGAFALEGNLLTIKIRSASP